jgi:hypothetical protein
MEIKKETPEQRTGRQVKNAWIHSMGFCEKSEFWAKMKLKKRQIKRCKKSFGVQYMDMIENKASADELDQCLQASQRRIEVIKNDLAELKGAVARIDEKMDNKLHKNPGKEVQRTRPTWLFPSFSQSLV